MTTSIEAEPGLVGSVEVAVVLVNALFAAQCQLTVMVAPEIVLLAGVPLKVLSMEASLPMVSKVLPDAGGKAVDRDAELPPPEHAVSPAACCGWRTALRSACRAAFTTASL